jgi:hypothetical protein
MQEWYPSIDQLKDPVSLERTIRQILKQHYDLVNKMKSQSVTSSKESMESGNGPADTKLLGLYVEPVDTDSLDNGATLKFNKSRNTFSFQ